MGLRRMTLITTLDITLVGKHGKQHLLSMRILFRLAENKGWIFEQQPKGCVDRCDLFLASRLSLLFVD